MVFTPAFAGFFCAHQNKAVLKLFISSGKCFSTAAPHIVINDKSFKSDSYTNVTPTILSRLNRKLHKVNHHPIFLLKERIVQYFHKTFTNTRGNPLFSLHDDLSPVVTVQQNFDSLLVPQNHPSRASSDCYYINNQWMLRSHMTAHQPELIATGLNNFLIAGDVYRKDAIDATHYPVFHQLDAVRLLSPHQLSAGAADRKAALAQVEAELKGTLEGLAKDLFGKDVKYRWCEGSFPFTNPSWELEIWLESKWIEVLGCGVIEQKILENVGCPELIGWAFGLGLDRLAMIYYSIPDIRIFWSKDPAFLRQFQHATPADRPTFAPFSSFPPCHLDLSFWLPPPGGPQPPFCPQAFEGAVADCCGDLLEHLELIDKYVEAKSGRESLCYRVHYRSMVKTLTKQEVRAVHEELEKKVAERFKVVVR